MAKIDDAMYEDVASIAQEKKDQDWDSLTADTERAFDFQNQLEEVMLQNELIEVVDLRFQEVSNQRESSMTDLEAGLRDWSKDYDDCISNPPSDGDILSTMGEDTDVLLVLELKENHPPFIYGRAFVPEIVGQPLGWYLQDTDSENSHGWKCILLPRARTELIRKYGLQSETMRVKSLRVVRPSQSGMSLLCEVHKYCDEPEAEAEAEAKAEGSEIEVQESKVEEPGVQEPEVTLKQ